MVPSPAFSALAAIALLGSPGLARAEDDRLWRHAEAQVSLEIPADFEIVPGGDALLALRGPGVRATIVRVDRANRAAWRGRDAFFQQVLDGVRAVATARSIKSDQLRLGRVPGMDLSFLRDTAAGEQRVAMRMLFFRRYTIVLTLAEDEPRRRRVPRSLRNLRRSLVPYFAPETPPDE